MRYIPKTVSTDDPNFVVALVSPRWTINGHDVWKIIKGGLVSMAGAALGALAAWLLTLIPIVRESPDFYDEILVSLIVAAQVGVNSLWKLLDGPPKDEMLS